jgi:hypothetical protein
VVLSDTGSLPASLESDLSTYVRAGGSVLIAAGTALGRRSRVPVFGASILQTHYYSNSGGSYLTVGDVDPSYPSIAKADRWSGVKFYYATQVDASGSRVIARLADQTPLLIEKTIGEGRVLLLASGLDNVTNDFPLHPQFVPFVEQTAFYLSGTERRSGSQTVDSFVELRNAKEQAVGVEVIDPDGHRPLSLKDAASAKSFQLTRAGFYQFRLANGRQDVVGANPDRRESDLAVMPPDVQSLWSGNGGTQPKQPVATNEASDRNTRDPLWWYVMLFALIAALAESWVANQHLAARGEDL